MRSLLLNLASAVPHAGYADIPKLEPVMNEGNEGVRLMRSNTLPVYQESSRGTPAGPRFASPRLSNSRHRRSCYGSMPEMGPIAVGIV